MKCKVCKKEFEYYDSTCPNRKFCSIKCRNKYWDKYKISAFYDLKIQRKNIEKGHKTQRKEKKGFWDSNFQKEMAKRGASKGGKIGGPIVSKILRDRKRIKFNLIKISETKKVKQ